MTFDRKTFTTKIFYRIKPASGGGFIAEADDSSLPRLEAPTREELVEKIKSTINPLIQQEWDTVKLPEGSTTYEIESKPGGGFTLHSTDPTVKPVETASLEEADRQLEEQLAGTLDKELAHQLTHEFPHLPGLENSKVVVDQKITFTVNRNDLNSDSKSALPAGWKRDVPIAPEKGSNSALFWMFLALAAIAALIYLLSHR